MSVLVCLRCLESLTVNLNVQAGEHILHVALAMQSPSRLVQVHALQLIKVVSPFTGDLAEQLLVQALESLPYNALQADAQCESSDSSSEMA